MVHFVLIYDVVDDFASKRTPFREEHLRFVREAHERGDIVMAGALGDPIKHALIVFRPDGQSAAEAFAKADPYVTNGIVTKWEVLPWNVVVGP
ncbi:MAG: hypothetical protein HY646_14620 [Acidobacteria bacterium]|nr:hypothetical protein [Acidobacteriota bacterium]